ncbi:putative integral membrane protein [Theileria parva strain Muguga]|uniref:Uncharacterized protein n=1 Tax=Theileria parva TaxID=5875 RepID=Q4N1Y6_THEPA|nr:putative integral membrane protein [Theileria parva strain Muguga]EAN31943.1 putative integral membrane protein [Theileria parva strain Muguga]|eukprot:XP_764226.1 hypothetical protein [Theileria parva strain Muguga]
MWAKADPLHTMAKRARRAAHYYDLKHVTLEGDSSIETPRICFKNPFIPTDTYMKKLNSGPINISKMYNPVQHEYNKCKNYMLPEHQFSSFKSSFYLLNNVCECPTSSIRIYIIPWSPYLCAYSSIQNPDFPDKSQLTPRYTIELPRYYIFHHILELVGLPMLHNCEPPTKVSGGSVCDPHITGYTKFDISNLTNIEITNWDTLLFRSKIDRAVTNVLKSFIISLLMRFITFASLIGSRMCIYVRCISFLSCLFLFTSKVKVRF